MKKCIKWLAMAMIAIFCVCACSRNSGKSSSGASQEKSQLKVVSTIYPIHDWVSQVTGKNKGNIDSKLLVSNGLDLHSYQPSAEDIAAIQTADVVISVGGHSDRWVLDAVKNATGKKPAVIELMKVPGIVLREEEPVDGHEHHEHHHEHHHDGKEVKDEHVWLSLKNAAASIKAIENALSKLDAANASDYKANADAYIVKLNELDADYKKALSKVSDKTLVFADRFPFRYLVEDYGLEAVAAFDGCSTETQASFKTISRLAKAVDAHSSKALLILENNNQQIAKSVLALTRKPDLKILPMDSMQVYDSKGSKGYLEIMRANLDVLMQAFGLNSGA